VGTSAVGETQPFRFDPSLIVRPPKVILPIRQPPWLTAPSLT